MFQVNPVEVLGIEIGSVPVDINGTGLDGDYVNLSKCTGGLLIIINSGAGTTTAAVTVKQCKTAANSDSSEKALTLSTAFKWSKVALTGTVWVKAAVTSDTFNLAGVANTAYALWIPAASLDQANGFIYARLNVADPSASQFLSSVYILTGVKDPRAILADFKV